MADEFEKTDNHFDIIFSILDIEKFDNENANKFINLLTDHSNPIREAVAFRLEDINDNELKYFLNDFAFEKIQNAITDINPNISRSVCNFISKHDVLKSEFEKRIIFCIENILNEINLFEKNTKDTFLKNNKSHAKNKKLFSLYWLLEALSIVYSSSYQKQVSDILKITINFSDYTIREKTAKILAKMQNPDYELLQKAKSDSNFYVKMQVYDRINKDDYIKE